MRHDGLQPSSSRYPLPLLADIDRGNCGIGLIASRSATPSRAIVEQAIIGLSNMQHRGGLSSDNTTGDGAGIMVGLPQRFFAREWARLTKFFPNPASIGVGMMFLAPDTEKEARSTLEAALKAHGIRRFVWRQPPTNPAALGQRARATLPNIMQILTVAPPSLNPDNYERALYLARKQFERRARHEGWAAYVVSLSSRTLVYKGLMLAPQLADFYRDLQHPEFKVTVATFHQRYSTNTLPSWERAQPFRVLCHNGEINTLQGNIAWTHARTPRLFAEFGEGISFTPDKLNPVLDTQGSDSAMLDNLLELLHLGGRDLRHAMAMLMPAAWENHSELPQAVRDFYDFHAHLQEPWDGPAAVVFTDGQIVGATLDRNGLRPLRYSLTDELFVVASEDGAIPLPEASILERGKLGPGQMIAADLRDGTLLRNGELKRWLASREHYGAWLNQVSLPDVPAPDPLPDLTSQQAAFGYTHEESIIVLRPMAETGKEPVGSMGDDTPPAVLTPLPRPLFSYFRQRFAEVTNPAIDPLRETLVMSLKVRVGPTGNRLDQSAHAAFNLTLDSPVLSPAQAAGLLATPDFSTTRLSTLVHLEGGPAAFEATLAGLLVAARRAVEAGVGIIVLSDRGVDPQHSFIPSLLAVSAVHHDLIRHGLRAPVSLVVETGEARDVHQVAALIGYGAEAVCPYLAWELAPSIARDTDPDVASQNYRTALEAGLRKIMSKMGISTVDAYCGAQIFESIGLDRQFVERYFPGTAVHAPGADITGIAGIMLGWHRAAFPDGQAVKLTSPGYFKFKRRGEPHAFSPDTVSALHQAVRVDGALNGNFPSARTHYQRFVAGVTEAPPVELRDLLDVVPAAAPLPLDRVEATHDIVRRFSGAAMSHGALSSEVHEALATGMNRIGAWSNSGEGGEARARFGQLSNSRVKQVASGRFGVTPEYLLSADELQIKIAQGAKPGEGGQLPGHKVSDEIAAIRHARPGTSLISPPPHHDIYSIEDLAQLIFDLRQINPRAAISVKLVAQSGVGTIAAGVAKAGADIIGISGGNGGTGAAAWSSIKNAGLPWELGLVETQTALLRNGLRGQVRVRVDGGFRTGRDVVVAALLGADEFSFGTSALIALGCIMARTCHNNNCPVGVASQRPELRARFPGKPEHLMTYMQLIAEDVREYLSRLGAPTLQAIIGRSDLLRQALPGLDGQPPVDLGVLTSLPLPHSPHARAYNHEANPVNAVEPLNRKLRNEAAFNVRIGRPMHLSYAINSSNRTFGALLSREIIEQHGAAGLADDSIQVVATGVAGQSFGAFNAPGLSLMLRGSANDYVGKGMGGGKIVVVPHEDYRGAHPTLAGNTVLYGATGGELYLAGRAGERFAVRNSGAVAVVEGVGDHGCEYMTGGEVVILGTTGLNFGAGMTGGRAFVWDADGQFATRTSPDVTVAPLSDADAAQLHALLTRHRTFTRSPRAGALLDGWMQAIEQFVAVLPATETATIAQPSDETTPAH